MNNTIEVLEELLYEAEHAYDNCVEGMKEDWGEKIDALTKAITTLKALESAADMLPDMEVLAEQVHKAYCKYCIDINGEEYWTKGDYSKLKDETKVADRYTVKAVLSLIEPILAKQILKVEELEAEAKLGNIPYKEAIALKDRVKDIEAKYNELIMAVGKKWKDETRHQTALRYIRQAEECNTGTGEAKIKEIEKSISDVLTQRDMWKTDYAELQAENKELKEQQLTVDTIEKVFDKHTIIANSDILYRKDLAIHIIKAREAKQHRTCDPECPFYKTEEASK